MSQQKADDGSAWRGLVSEHTAAACIKATRDATPATPMHTEQIAFSAEVGTRRVALFLRWHPHGVALVRSGSVAVSTVGPYSPWFHALSSTVHIPRIDRDFVPRIDALNVIAEIKTPSMRDALKKAAIRTLRLAVRSAGYSEKVVAAEVKDRLNIGNYVDNDTATIAAQDKQIETLKKKAEFLASVLDPDSITPKTDASEHESPKPGRARSGGQG